MKDPRRVVRITSRQRAVAALEGAWMAAHKVLKSDAVSIPQDPTSMVMRVVLKPTALPASSRS